ncbi:MAG: MFS transporter [Ktedonobacteraceae bacterium]
MSLQSTSKRPLFHVPVALHPLTTKNFGIIWAGAFLSNVGFWIQTVAQGWQVLQLTNSALLLGLVSFFAMVPNLVLSLFGGVIADKWNRRHLLLATQTIYMATAILPGVLTTLGVIKVWHLLLIALVNGIFSAVGFPAWQTFISDLAPDGELKQSIALNSMQFNLSRVVGPAIGGLSIGIFGIAGSYYMNGLSYIAVILPLLLMRPEQRHYLKQAKQSIWSNLAVGLLYVKKRPVLQVALGLQLLIAFFIFPYTTLLPVFARDIFRTGPAGLGVLNATAGIGALLGAILLVALTERLRQPVQALLVLCLVGGTASVIFALMPAQHLALPLLIVLGVSTVMSTTLTNTAIQSSTPEEVRGRVISIWITITFGLAPCGSLLAGFAAQMYGASRTLVVGGLLCIMIAILLVLLTRTALRPTGETRIERA